MSEKLNNVFISTHARALLSSYPVIANLIIKHGEFIKEKAQRANEGSSNLPFIIGRREIEDALAGPLQGFFKEKIAAYMRIAQIQMELSMKEDETFKDKRAQIPNEKKIPTSILENTSLTDLAKIQKELDELTSSDARQWEESHRDWEQRILLQLNNQKFVLSELEIKEFLDQEPYSELLERFATLQVALPKTKSAQMNCSKYIALKITIAIQSALSRQHLPHAQSDIQKILNTLKSEFSAIAKEETKLATNQKTATDDILKPIL